MHAAVGSLARSRSSAGHSALRMSGPCTVMPAHIKLRHATSPFVLMDET